jgi:pyruvate dehydrogenase phosphatase
MYAHRVVSLTAATSLENLRALNEVRDFATTDMGLGGPERWTYRILQEPRLSSELQNIANPQSGGGIDTIDFQPCKLHDFRSQDRMCIEHWQMPPGGTWVFTALFDGQCVLFPQGLILEVCVGHAGHATVEHAAQSLPGLIKQALESLLVSTRGYVVPSAVSGVLSDCIIRFDHSITADFTRMFPGGPAALQSMSSSQIRHLFQDRASATQNFTAAMRCLQGTTALLTLTDPSKQNLWIANLGDCQAGMSAYDSLFFTSGPQSFHITNVCFSSRFSYTYRGLVCNLRDGTSRRRQSL